MKQILCAGLLSSPTNDQIPRQGEQGAFFFSTLIPGLRPECPHGLHLLKGEATAFIHFVIAAAHASKDASVVESYIDWLVADGAMVAAVVRSNTIPAGKHCIEPSYTGQDTIKDTTGNCFAHR